MGILKSYAIAGGLLVASTVQSFAADFPAHAPPVGPAPIPVVEFSGWYLRGDVGVSMQTSKEWYHGSVAAAPGGRFLRQSIGDSAHVGMGIGYQFNSWFRADLTHEYRAAAGVKAIDTYNFTCNFVGGSCTAIGQVVPRSNIWDGKFKSHLFLANFYADLGTWQGLSPYIGFGVGGARNTTYGVVDFDPSEFGGGGYAANATKWSFAWAVHAGLSYAVTQNLKLDMGYRYVSLGDAKVGTLTCLPACAPGTNTGAIRKIDAHELRLGMRWMFADVPAYVAPVRKVYAKN
jgi:opacity protein-like surface antigen